MAKEMKVNSTWDIEDAHRTLQRAAAIQADKKMMKDVVSHHNLLTKVLGGSVKNTPAKASPVKPTKKK